MYLDSGQKGSEDASDTIIGRDKASPESGRSHS